MTRSPFPGMDPIIEARGLWRDFHDKLIGDIERVLAELLPPRYVVCLDERTFSLLDGIEPAEWFAMPGQPGDSSTRTVANCGTRGSVGALKSLQSLSF